MTMCRNHIPTGTKVATGRTTKENRALVQALWKLAYPERFN